MKHIIMGTAGHVDHGKTALVKALTNIDCDTHPEEKKRGITINLGFSHLNLSDDTSIGIVDVPGHKDFVHTMVAGASGIDFVVLVIAADSGVMPQTREHLQILDTLGVKNGLIALTKIDLVDQELVDLAKEEIRELVDWPIVPVSSITGQGLDDLKKEILELSSKVSERPTGKVFRLFVDRIFTVSGFGTIVAGSVLSGKLSKDADAYLLPGFSDPLRARRIERHGKEVQSVKAGDRASINLLGLKKESFKRGMVIADRQLKETQLIDVRLKLFPNSPKFKLWTQVVFHVGTYEKQAKIHLIDKDVALGGETVLAQIHLDALVVLLHGDRFVVRNSSSEITLGGGEVIDAHPLHHKRRPEKLLKSIKSIASAKLPELIFSEVRKRYGAVSLQDIADILNIAAEEVGKIVDKEVPDDIVCKKDVLIIKSRYEKFVKEVMAVIRGFHRRNPLSDSGISKAELMGTLGVSEKLLELVLAELEEDNLISEKAKSWSVFGHKVELSGKIERDISIIDRFFKQFGMQTPLLSELEILVRKNHISDKDLKQILHYLIKEGRAYKIEDDYLHADVVNSCREKLVEKLRQTKQGLRVADFRNLVSGNRKICLLLLAQYDKEGITKRSGDFRILK